MELVAAAESCRVSPPKSLKIIPSGASISAKSFLLEAFKPADIPAKETPWVLTYCHQLTTNWNLTGSNFLVF